MLSYWHRVIYVKEGKSGRIFVFRYGRHAFYPMIHSLDELFQILSLRPLGLISKFSTFSINVPPCVPSMRGGQPPVPENLTGTSTSSNYHSAHMLSIIKIEPPSYAVAF